MSQIYSNQYLAMHIIDNVKAFAAL